MNNVDIEGIDQVIKLLKENLDFTNSLGDMIEIGATGYKLTFEIEQFEKYIKKKKKSLEDSLHKKYEVKLKLKDSIEIYQKLDEMLRHLTIPYPLENLFIKFGTKKIRDLKEDKDMKIEDRRINYKIDNRKEYIINKIGYLEFLKQKPKPKEITADYEEELDDFIGFLDEKFKEWKQNRSEKNN